MLEGLIDQRTTVEEQNLGTIDDLVNETTKAAGESQTPTAVTPAPAVVAPAAKPVVVPDASGIPGDLLDEEKPEVKPAPYDINADEGVSPELRADILKQPKKTQEAFGAMRIQIRELEKAQAGQKGGLTDEERTTLVEENKQLQDRIEKADFVKSPRFQREHIAPINALTAQMVQAGKDYGIEENDMKQALNMSRADRATFLAEKITNQNGLSEILPMYSQYGALVERAKSSVENYTKTVTAAITLEREAQAKALATHLTSAQDKLFKEGYTLLRESKTNPDWLPNLKKEAAAIVAGEIDPASASEAALRSVVARHQISSLSSQLDASKAMVEDLRKKLSKYVTLSPNASGNRSTTTPAALDPQTATIDDLVKEVSYA